MQSKKVDAFKEYFSEGPSIYSRNANCVLYSQPFQKGRWYLPECLAFAGTIHLYIDGFAHCCLLSMFFYYALVCDVPVYVLPVSTLSGRWPAVICPSPFGGHSICKDYDGEPISYHVEFLGSEHSHTWINAKYVDVYKQVESVEELYVSARQHQRLSKSQSQGQSQDNRKVLTLLCTLLYLEF